MRAFDETTQALDEQASVRTELQPVDHAAFFDTLDAPPQATPRLREAFAGHAARVLST
ncbi:DUF1778 domain-containing protein [Breoghania sp. L-A4]|uniref:type II toxin -antitoxin system TacA 1-like antitoxin n=1 Tax=Breoghania sp. L-A4 TaxID=2304600 RepID=UPI0013C377AB|nr:DUF1778 domain-containing protein [Breoghania sp. L-A4]